MVKLNEFEKALCFAPAVSIEYWQSLSEKYAKHLEQQGSEETVQACLLANRVNDAVRICHEREEFEDGKLIKAL